MAVKRWTARALLYEFNYDAGTNTPVVGETLNVDGEEGDETCVIHSWTVAGGSWAGNNASGKMWVYSASATFIANLENNNVIENASADKICDVTGGVTLKGADGDWQLAGNWNDGEDPAVPAASDEVIFDAASVLPVLDGIAVGETGGVDFDLLHIKAGYSGDIGTASERLHTSANKIITEGTGTYYIEVSEDATGKDQAIPLVIINNRDGTVYLTSNQNDGSWCCEFTEVIVSGGTVYIGDTNIDTAVQCLRIVPTNNKASNVTVIMYEDCVRTKAVAYNPEIYMTNGTCTCDSACTLIEMFNGTFNYGIDGTEETGLNIATLRLFGGTFNWYPDDTDGDAEIADLWLFGGEFVSNADTNNDRAKLLGSGAGDDIYVFEGALLDIANNMGNITIAASSQLWNLGGVITTDSGAQIAVTYNQP